MSEDKYTADGLRAVHLQLVRTTEATEALATDEEREVLEEVCLVSKTRLLEIYADVATRSSRLLSFIQSLAKRRPFVRASDSNSYARSNSCSFADGYTDLEISLQFASGSLATFLSISYGDKVPASVTVSADDIEGKLYGKLPSEYTKNETAFKKTVKADEATFKPLGTRVATYGKKLLRKEPVQGKGKARVTTEEEEDEDEASSRWVDCDPEEEGAVVFEAWRVS